MFQDVINELLKYDVSKFPNKQLIKVFQFKEVTTIDINFSIPENTNIESQYILINLKLKEYKPNLSDGLRITVKSVKLFLNIKPTIDYLYYTNVFTLNKYKNTITFRYQCQQGNGPFIEFGERYNSKDLDIAIENNNAFATFQNNI